MEFKNIYNLGNCDLHVHTRYSKDSFISPRKVALFAEKYDRFIAITDHNEIQGALDAKKYDKKNRIIVGEEIMATDIGIEILAYNIERRINPGKAIEIIKEIHDQGGLAVLAHPFQRGYLLRKVLPILPDDLIQAIDGVEVYNARNKEKENTKASNLADRYKKIRTKGSDAHMIWELYFKNYNFASLNLLKIFFTIIIKQTKKLK
jgi:predicted metal-dependent phosphoesterase TrpH